MRLPNAHLAIVEEPKIRDYLLNPEHRFGAGKARFFAEFGFTRENWQALVVALREHGMQNEVASVRETGFGPRYAVEGELAARDGRRPRVCSVWQVDVAQITPCLITAYPSEANE